MLMEIDASEASVLSS